MLNKPFGIGRFRADRMGAKRLDLTFERCNSIGLAGLLCCSNTKSVEDVSIEVPVSATVVPLAALDLAF
jgi:hypothetical protein